MSHIKDLLSEFQGNNDVNRPYCPNCRWELAARYKTCDCDRMYCKCASVVDYLYCRNCGKKESELCQTETTKNITPVSM